MNPLELKHLRNFCQKHEIDTAYIDSSLSYDENLEELNQFVSPYEDFFNPDYSLIDKDSPQALEMKRQIESLEESFKHQPLNRKYGIPDWAVSSLEKPFVIFNFYFKVPYRLNVLMKQKLEKFSDVVTWYSKWYFKVQGTQTELKDVLAVLPREVHLFKYDKVWEKRVIYTGERWVRLPEIGVPLKILHA